MPNIPNRTIKGDRICPSICLSIWLYIAYSSVGICLIFDLSFFFKIIKDLSQLSKRLDFEFPFMKFASLVALL